MNKKLFLIVALCAVIFNKNIFGMEGKKDSNKKLFLSSFMIPTKKHAIDNANILNSIHIEEEKEETHKIYLKPVKLHENAYKKTLNDNDRFTLLENFSKNIAQCEFITHTTAVCYKLTEKYDKLLSTKISDNLQTDLLRDQIMHYVKHWKNLLNSEKETAINWWKKLKENPYDPTISEDDTLKYMPYFELHKEDLGLLNSPKNLTYYYVISIGNRARSDFINDCEAKFCAVHILNPIRSATDMIGKNKLQEIQGQQVLSKYQNGIKPVIGINTEEQSKEKNRIEKENNVVFCQFLSDQREFVVDSCLVTKYIDNWISELNFEIENPGYAIKKNDF